MPKFVQFVTQVSVGVFLAVVSCTAGASGQSPTIERAVNDASRLQRHRDRDASRQPSQVLEAAGVKSSDTVLDIASFGGYYTALLSRVVGESGRVYAVDSGLAIEALQQFNLGALTPRFLMEDQRRNVVYSVAQRLDALSVPEPVDAAFLVLNYHDTVWTGENRDRMNRAIYDALKPGGIYVVIDHNAAEGAGFSQVNTIHRIERRAVRAEVLRAGFELAGDHDFLRNAKDAKDKHIVDPSIRGQTDRFVLIFRKPR